MNGVAFPTHAELFDALRAVGRVLNREWAFLDNGVYHFTLGDDWSLGVAPESAGRLRLAVWRGGRSQCTVWSQVTDHSRLEEAVEGLASDVLTLTR